MMEEVNQFIFHGSTLSIKSFSAYFNVLGG